jgi:hypothetical protein
VIEPLLKTFTINLELRKPVAGQYLVLSVSQPLVEAGETMTRRDVLLYSAFGGPLPPALVTWRLAASVSKRTHTMSVRYKPNGVQNPQSETSLDRCGHCGSGRGVIGICPEIYSSVGFGG